MWLFQSTDSVYLCVNQLVDRQSKDLGSNPSAAGREGSFFHRDFEFLISLELIKLHNFILEVVQY